MLYIPSPIPKQGAQISLLDGLPGIHMLASYFLQLAWMLLLAYIPTTPFHGAVIEKERLAIVMEFVPRGSLYSLLRTEVRIVCVREGTIGIL
eukprot:354763-Chlamydomonas_euryale.AAC.3